ncbi:MAG: hypothetical protein KDB87_12785, partial [Flavobacteriales bacterium]|nr:hypothetical protein [Flavobacteriales bacterium]
MSPEDGLAQLVGPIHPGPRRGSETGHHRERRSPTSRRGFLFLHRLEGRDRLSGRSYQTHYFATATARRSRITVI